MKKVLIISLMALLSLSVIVPAEPAQAQGDGYTDCGRDPVYSRDFYGSPKVGLFVRSIACMTGSEVLATLSPNEDYHVIAETDGWYKVKMNNGTTGWVGASLFNKETANNSNELISKTGNIAVTADDHSNVEIKTVTVDTGLTNKVKGYILLQVESAGEAWYVNPTDSQRYYMKDGGVAYQMMRNFGLGISNPDLDRLLNGDYSLSEKLRGRIVLAVERNGEAYYVNPKDRSVHYMRDGAAAYQIMRNLSLGITNNDLGKIPSKETVSTSSSSSNTNSNGTMILSGYSDDGKVFLNWNVSGFTSDQGFKVVKSENVNPVYPGDAYKFYTNSDQRNHTWTGLENGKTYHFRVCEYLGGKCGKYSNDIAVTVKGGETQSNTSNGTIALTASEDAGKVYLNWNLNGMTSNQGFKIVYSENANPVYPGNTYKFYTNGDQRNHTWTGLQAGKTYHFRVCEYLGGKCGVYSNDVAVTISGTQPTSNTNGSISLNGTVDAGKVYLNWNLQNMTSNQGFKIVYSLYENPVYPGNTYKFYSNSDQRNHTWENLTEGQTYHFRVCEYLGGKCGVYSNDLEVQIPYYGNTMNVQTQSTDTFELTR